MKQKFKYKIRSIYLYNRWKHKYPPCNWCIIGLSVHWFGYSQFDYRLCLFGIELRFDIERY